MWPWTRTGGATFSIIEFSQLARVATCWRGVAKHPMAVHMANHNQHESVRVHTNRGVRARVTPTHYKQNPRKTPCGHHPHHHHHALHTNQIAVITSRSSCMGAPFNVSHAPASPGLASCGDLLHSHVSCCCLSVSLAFLQSVGCSDSSECTGDTCCMATGDCSSKPAEANV